MNIILRIRRFFKRNYAKLEVWDTSAISNCFERLLKILNNTNNQIVITEGVMHELSAGRKISARCKECYDFLTRYTGYRIVNHATPDNIRMWTIDEQVVATAEKYHKKGYDVTLVTCDRDQAYKAELKCINVELICVQEKRVNEKTVFLEEFAANVNRKENTTLERTQHKKEFCIPCIKMGKNTFIKVSLNFAVYGNGGKRKIGKGAFIQVDKTDLLEKGDVKFAIRDMKERFLLLSKVS